MEHPVFSGEMRGWKGLRAAKPSRIGRLAGLMLLGGLLAACSSAEPRIEPPVADVAPGFQDTSAIVTVRPGERLKIVAYGLDSLTGDYRIDEKGALNLGSLGVVHAAGLTYPQVEERIGARLAEKGHPGVRVSVMPDNG